MKKEKQKESHKYSVQLSQYGTVSYSGVVEVEANSEEEACINAEIIVNKDPDKYFGDVFEVVEGWNVQVEDVREIK